jgi:O-antigen/teichoic acid export membrane protein
MLVWVNQHLIKNIPTEEYAIYPVILSLMITAEIVTKAFTGGIGRFVVEEFSLGNTQSITKICSSMLPILVLVSILLGIVGVVLSLHVDSIVKVDKPYVDDAALMLFLLVFTLCVSIVTTPYTLGLYVKQNFLYINAIDLIVEITRIFVALTLLFGYSNRVLWLVVASTVAQLLGILMRIYFTRREIPALKFDKHRFCKKTAIKILKFGSWTSTSGVTNLVQRTGPFMLLSHLSNATQITMLYLGILVEANIRKLLDSALRPLQPALTKKYVEKGMEGLSTLYYRGGRYHLWVILFITPPLVAIRYEIVDLYVGEEFRVAGDIMLFYLLAFPFNYAGAMFYRIAYASGKVSTYFKSELALTLAFFVLMLYLVAVEGMGGLGVSIAAFVTAAIINPLLFWPLGLKLIRGNSLDFFRQTLLPGLLPFIVSLFACYLYASFFEVSNWFGVSVVSSISSVVYVSVTYFFCMIGQDRELVHKVTGKISKLVRSEFPLLFKTKV